MARPVIGIISNTHVINDDYEVHAGGKLNFSAVAQAADCLPIMVPSDPSVAQVADLMEACDGFLLTGGRPNVHPEEYGEAETEAHGQFDRQRDQLVLPLVRAVIERGQPLFGICRGFQEINVALGGSLYPEIRDLPGRMNHRMPPDGTLEEKFALRHAVSLTNDGPFARILGATEVMTNTLHGQGLKTVGQGVIVDGWAPDQTPEAIYVKDAPGFALAVQWHPEWQAAQDPVSRPLFQAFGEAAHAWRDGRAYPLKRSA